MIPQTFPHTYLPALRKKKNLLVISLLLAGVGFYYRNGDALTGWASFILFSIFALLLIVQIIPGSSYLRVDKQGFEICSLFRKQRYEWHQVQQFGLYQERRKQVVAYNLDESFRQQSRMKRANQWLVGFDSAIPETYGMAAPALADLMNAMKQTYGVK